MAPAAAASTWRALLSRHKLKRALTAWFWMSCSGSCVARRVSPAGVRHPRRERQGTHCAEAPAVRLPQDRDEQVDRAGVLQRVERGGQHRQVFERLEEDGEQLGLEDVSRLDEPCRRHSLRRQLRLTGGDDGGERATTHGGGSTCAPSPP